MTTGNETHDETTREQSARATLLQRAEEQATAMGIEKLEEMAPEQVQQLLHELLVDQIELELQGEELRRVQEALEISRARYFDLYDLAPVGYVTLSEQGMIREANLTAATLWGVPRSALVKQPLTRFILPKDQDIYYLLWGCRPLTRRIPPYAPSSMTWRTAFRL
jgi:PAS domain-containing protein